MQLSPPPLIPFKKLHLLQAIFHPSPPYIVTDFSTLNIYTVDIGRKVLQILTQVNLAALQSSIFTRLLAVFKGLYNYKG
jgi:hypothetical protein